MVGEISTVNTLRAMAIVSFHQHAVHHTNTVTGSTFTHTVGAQLLPVSAQLWQLSIRHSSNDATHYIGEARLAVCAIKDAIAG